MTAGKVLKHYNYRYRYFDHLVGVGDGADVELVVGAEVGNEMLTCWRERDSWLISWNL
jgi:hypothetical protein